MAAKEDRVVLAARALEVGYRGRALLPPVDFEMRPGQLWGLIGPNGAGKTTLLRTLLGLQPRVAGELERGDGVRVAYVPQREDAGPGVPGRAKDVVADGLDRGWSFLDPVAHWRRRPEVRRALAEAGAAAFANQRFLELSEGQKQRVRVAGALVSSPDLLVLDEPTSAMDQAGEHAVFDLLEALRVSRNLAVLVVSHHAHLMLQHVTHLLFVDRECRTVAAGAVDEVLSDPCVRAHFAEGGFEHPQASGVTEGGRP